MPEGCDISEFQTTEPAADFAIVRAHSGYRKDTRVDQHWAVYASRGTPRGTYVYLVPSRDIGWQVMQMMDICPDPEIGFWIDAEDGGLTKTQILTALDIAKGRAGGRTVGLYGGIPFLSARGLNPGAWPWWVSHYGVNDGVRHPIVNPSVPSGWPAPVIHQYTSNPYDRNYCTAEVLARLQGTPAPPPPTQEDDDVGVLYQVAYDPAVYFCRANVRTKLSGDAQVRVEQVQNLLDGGQIRSVNPRLVNVETLRLFKTQLIASYP